MVTALTDAGHSTLTDMQDELQTLTKKIVQAVRKRHQCGTSFPCVLSLPFLCVHTALWFQFADTGAYTSGTPLEVDDDGNIECGCHDFGYAFGPSLALSDLGPFSGDVGMLFQVGCDTYDNDGDERIGPFADIAYAWGVDLDIAKAIALIASLGTVGWEVPAGEILMQNQVYPGSATGGEHSGADFAGNGLAFAASVPDAYVLAMNSALDAACAANGCCTANACCGWLSSADFEIYMPASYPDSILDSISDFISMETLCASETYEFYGKLFRSVLSILADSWMGNHGSFQESQ